MRVSGGSGTKVSGVCIVGGLFLFASVSISYSQSVVIDGSTATTVTNNANGSVNIDIAPANGAGTSLNRYNDFNVGLPGVNLDNTTVGAQTIVNEVTSSRPSNINGALNVLGNQADVIIANPNGITVNGGSFNNTGNVGLVTGNVTLDASGRVTTQVRGGQITVGAGGLSGTINELDLIAKNIRVNGNIQGANPDSITSLNFYAGDSDITFDPNRSLPNVFPWADVTSVEGNNADVVSVDITRPSSIAAGSIRIGVTDQGAGVRVAGNALASSGSFRITTDGKLLTSGAQITATGAVDIRAGEVALSSDDQQTTLTSQTSGVVVETTSGGINLGDSRLQGEIVSSSNLGSAGGITLISSGEVIQSGQDSEHDAGLVSNQDGIAIFAQGGVLLEETNVNSGEDFVITTTGKIDVNQSVVNTEGDISLLATEEVAVLSSQLNAEDNISVTASSALFDVDEEATQNTRSELVTQSGGIFIETLEGDVVNNGSLIQGGDRFNGDSRADGALTIISAGDIVNTSLDLDHLAVLFGEEDALSLTSQGTIFNDNGRLFSNADLRITAAHDFINETRLTGSTQELVITTSEGSRLAQTLWLKRKKNTSVIGDFGELAIDDELALVIAIGDVTINADNIRNIGADISGGNVNLAAGMDFTNSASLVGNIVYNQTCRIFCRGSGSSNVRLLGGTITGANDLRIEASNIIEARAGALVGNNNATFIAPSIIASGIQVPLVLERPSGLTGFFRGERTWVASNFVGSQFTAFGGDLTFDGDVDFTGATLFTLGEQIITGEQNIVAAPEQGILLGREDLGLLNGLF